MSARDFTSPITRCDQCETSKGVHASWCTAEADYYADHARESDEVDEEAEFAAMAAVDAYNKGAGPSVLFSN